MPTEHASLTVYGPMHTISNQEAVLVLMKFSLREKRCIKKIVTSFTKKFKGIWKYVTGEHNSVDQMLGTTIDIWWHH